MPNYPSPCLKCDKEYCKKGGSNHKECAEWLTWFRWWWKWFRTNLPKAEAARKERANKFFYAHPDEIKRYINGDPCEGCALKKNCDIPCNAYLRWYDARMEITRKKVGL